MAADIKVIWVGSEQEYFCKQGWTRDALICPSGQNQGSGPTEKIAGERPLSSDTLASPTHLAEGRYSEFRLIWSQQAPPTKMPIIHRTNS
jgi:hypothetical protein